MVKILPDIRNTSSEIYMNSALGGTTGRTTINVFLGVNDIFNCFNALLRDWECLQPEHKEIMSNFVDEFIIKMIDDRVSSCKS